MAQERIVTLGEQLKPIGHLVITDTMLNRVTLNWQRGNRLNPSKHWIKLLLPESG